LKVAIDDNGLKEYLHQAGMVRFRIIH